MGLIGKVEGDAVRLERVATPHVNMPHIHIPHAHIPRVTHSFYGSRKASELAHNPILHFHATPHIGKGMERRIRKRVNRSIGTTRSGLVKVPNMHPLRPGI